HPVAPDLVVARGGQLQDLLVAPGPSLVLKHLPVGGIGAGIGHIARKKERLGVFCRNSFGEPLADTRIGARGDRRIGKAHIPVSDQAEWGAGRELLEDERGRSVGEGCRRRGRESSRWQPEEDGNWKQADDFSEGAPWRARSGGIHRDKGTIREIIPGWEQQMASGCASASARAGRGWAVRGTRSR